MLLVSLSVIFSSFVSLVRFCVAWVCKFCDCLVVYIFYDVYVVLFFWVLFGVGLVFLGHCSVFVSVIAMSCWGCFVYLLFCFLGFVNWFRVNLCLFVRCSWWFARVPLGMGVYGV